MDFSSPYNGHAPLADTLTAHLYRQTASFHTPGHKGRAAVLKSLESLQVDLTELPDTGSLYDGGDAIEEAEILAARAFGADSTFFSAGGCTLCIQAMLALGAPPGGRVLMARNAHRSAVHAAALLGLDVVWLWPEGEADGGFQQPAVENVESALSADSSIRAVYVTSPDYGGRLCDIPALAAACRRAGAALLVDNAHGSHLGAFGRHPLALGADMTADSAHKTLPVLTGGAYLHMRGSAVTREQAKAAMALFGSTSPSFPVLASLDLARCWWEREGPEAYRQLAEEAEELRHTAAQTGAVAAAWPAWPEALKDPARLVLDGGPSGLTGEALAAYFRAAGCEPEHAGGRQVIFILTPFNTPEELARLRGAIEGVGSWAATAPHRESQAFAPFPAGEKPRAVLPMRQALLQEKESVLTQEAAGRIAAQTICPCPPGLAAAVPGEALSEALVQALARAGISRIVVLKTL